ncbi:MAG: choice-of-anchor G family protein, partial [Brevibacterium sp.]
MKILRGRQMTTGRKLAVGAVAAATALGLTLLVTSPSSAAQINPNEDAEAFAQLIDTDLISADLLDVSSAYRSFPIDTGKQADNQALNLEALQTLGVELPNIGLPLIAPEGGDGLLHIGNAGVLNSYAHAPSADSAQAGTGAVDQNGAINVDPDNPAASGNANVDLTSLFHQLGLGEATDELVDELRLELGAIASTATSDGETTTPDYTVTDGVLTVSSPAISDLTGTLTDTIDGTGDTLQEIIGDEGLASQLASIGINLNVLVAQVSVGGDDAEISVEVRDALNKVVEEVINTELTDDKRLVSVDLEEGDIKIDLAKVVKGENAEDLNGLDPNTQVLTDATIGTITTALADALGSLTERVNIALAGDPDAPAGSEESRGALDNVHLVIKLPASISLLGQTVNGGVTVDATLGQLAGSDTTPPTVTTDLRITVLGQTVNPGQVLNIITTPVINAVLGIIKPLIGGIIDSTASEVSGAVTGIVDPVVASLRPVLNALNEVVDLTINEQSPLPEASGVGAQSALDSSEVDGTNGPGFTVNAVSLELLPAGDVIDVNLASSSVRATAAEAPGDDDANVNASASASASANADNDQNAVAQAAAQAAADPDADDNSDTTAASDSTAQAAAQSASNEQASSDVSSDVASDPNASSIAAAQSAADPDDDSNDDTNAQTSAAADANPAAASEAASTADSSSEASVEAAADADGTEDQNG